MIKIFSIGFVILTLLSGCVTQTGPGTVKKDFDRENAAKNRVSLGLTYLKNGNYSSAKFNLDKALEFAPRSADANYAMAYYYQNVGELELADDAYQYAMDIEPNNADIANTYGAFLCQNGKYEKAKEYFLKAVNTSKYNSSAQTYENLALCSKSQGHLEEAVEYFRSAVNHQPSRASGLYLLTQSLIETKQWGEARDIFKRYERVAQVSPQSLLMAVSIEEGLGNHRVAEGYADMLIQLYPSHTLTLQYLKRKVDIAEKKAQSLNINALKSNTLVSKPISVSDTALPDKKVEVSEVANNQAGKDSIDKTGNTSTDKSQASAEGDTKVTKKTPPTYHIVSKGENLYRISLQYNIKMQSLVEWNNLNDESEIYNGMKLSLVVPDSVE